MARSEGAAEALLAATLLEELPDEAARVLENEADADTAALLARQREPARSAVLAALTPDRAARVLAALEPPLRARALASLDLHRAALLLARLDPEEREACLAGVDEALARELRELAAWPPDSAGSLMDPRVTTFRPDAQVSDVVRRLRRFRDKQVSDVFLVDEQGRLAGSVALQDAVLAEPDTPLHALVRGPAVKVQAVASQDEVVETLETHRLASLPVVDFEGRLLGVLRQRELLRAARDDATATAVTMVGASEQERALSTPFFAIRKRLPWLQVNLLTAFLAAAVVGVFESTIASVTALAVLLPVVAGQSGNTGAQALAVTMRGLALREIRVRQWTPVVLKEVLAGAGNGLAVAATTSLAVYLWSRSPGLATVIGVSMVVSMTLAGLSGAAIPLLLTALRQDPAQSSSIILTTVTDVVGFLSFLGIATLMMSRL